ncbi:MAG: hydantoinase B/oxoprolinase family protein, partial [Chloroflexi bacterium]|nr:hydantoinase B/oxoprolinase family protein [Chloroflexota bacterium]
GVAAGWLPIISSSLTTALQGCLEEYSIEDIKPGEALITSDPFHGGQHVQDILIFSPVFHGGKLRAFVGSMAHHLDVGGGAPGLNPKASDIYQEGLIIPPLKFEVERDWNGGILEQMIARNVRAPRLTIGDINAQFAANRIGEQRLLELFDKYGSELVLECMRETVAYSERCMREAISELPDGVYEAEDFIEGDGLSDKDYRIAVKVTVSGSDITVDFADTDQQATGNVNCPFGATKGATYCSLKMILTDQSVPFNAGCFRPVRIDAPFGSLVNPTPPAPVRARMLATFRIYNAIMKALAPVVPERVIAGGFDTTTVVSLSLLQRDRYGVFLEVLGGGYGANSSGDGADATDLPLTNCANTPVEALETDYGYIRVARYELMAGSGGAGKHRGGLGFRRQYQMLDDGVQFAIYSDRYKIRPFGLFGGEPGGPGRCYAIRGGETIELSSKAVAQLQLGDILTVELGGGGGYGRPEERDPEALRRDRSRGMA